MHYEAGNILARAGHPVIQAVTDPHVRPQYLDSLPNQKIYFCVFDPETKEEFIAKAHELKKHLNPHHVVVTGPPIDPRIVFVGKQKQSAVGHRTVPDKTLKLVITTGGLGQNYPEIKSVLEQLKRYQHQNLSPKIELKLYASTHQDFNAMYESFNLGPVLYADTIAAANELLISEAFPWADGFITKPSGDMAYDAAAAGCFCLFLKSWGEWEDNIADRFKQLNIGTFLDTTHVGAHLQALSADWIHHAQHNLTHLPPLFKKGCHDILSLHHRIS
jgi:hypothetical protein